MNVGQVQPTAELTHLMDADRMEDQKSISVSSSYSDKIVALNDSLKVAEETSKTYGATDWVFDELNANSLVCNRNYANNLRMEIFWRVW
ncbi:hypothetical protein ScPMuIL_006049 [Solemya velum]